MTMGTDNGLHQVMQVLGQYQSLLVRGNDEADRSEAVRERLGIIAMLDKHVECATGIGALVFVIAVCMVLAGTAYASLPAVIALACFAYGLTAFILLKKIAPNAQGLRQLERASKASGENANKKRRELLQALPQGFRTDAGAQDLHHALACGQADSVQEAREWQEVYGQRREQIAQEQRELARCTQAADAAQENYALKCAQIQQLECQIRELKDQQEELERENDRLRMSQYAR